MAGQPTDAQIDQLRVLHHLRSVSIAGLNSSSIAKLLRAPHSLEWTELWDLRGVDAASAPALRTLRGLIGIYTWRCSDVSFLPALSQLQKLHLRISHTLWAVTGDAVVEALSGCVHLMELALKAPVTSLISTLCYPGFRCYTRCTFSAAASWILCAFSVACLRCRTHCANSSSTISPPCALLSFVTSLDSRSSPGSNCCLPSLRSWIASHSMCSRRRRLRCQSSHHSSTNRWQPWWAKPVVESRVVGRPFRSLGSRTEKALGQPRQTSLSLPFASARPVCFARPSLRVAIPPVPCGAHGFSVASALRRPASPAERRWRAPLLSLADRASRSAERNRQAEQAKRTAAAEFPLFSSRCGPVPLFVSALLSAARFSSHLAAVLADSTRP